MAVGAKLHTAGRLFSKIRQIPKQFHLDSLACRAQNSFFSMLINCDFPFIYLLCYFFPPENVLHVVFSFFSHTSFKTATCLFTFLHLSSQRYVDRVCKTADQLMHWSCPESSRCCILTNFGICCRCCWLCQRLGQLLWHGWIVLGGRWEWRSGGPTH